MVDPVRYGLAASLARPGGNITGVAHNPGAELYSKRFQLLKDAVPSVAKLGFLISRAFIESIQVQVDDGRMTVHRGPTLLRLNEFGSRVFALCSGKLKTCEIVAHLAQFLGGDHPDGEVLQSDVLQFLRHLDENYAIFFKDY